jgi:glucose-6-phosphate 1-dehydrogenase
LLGADDRIRAYYLATGPDLFGPLAKRLGAEGLVTPRSRIIVEKPIGRDGETAAAINDVIGSVFLERNIFRIDHYLGKESVQNLMALRFANILLEPLWNNAHIDHVQITVAETLGVEGRRLLRRSRRDTRHGPKPHDAAPLPRCDGAAEFARSGFLEG